MHIIRDKRFKQIVKAAYAEGQKDTFELCQHLFRIDATNRGTIIGGYDIDKEIEEILRRKGV